MRRRARGTSTMHGSPRDECGSWYCEGADGSSQLAVPLHVKTMHPTGAPRTSAGGAPCRVNGCRCDILAFADQCLGR
eukprot:4817376-Pyramimonas_sp.AAC.1